MTARVASVWTLAHWHLPGNALVEFGLRRRLSLKVVPARDGALHLPERGRSGSPQAWRRGGFAEMGLDLARGTGVADEGDDSYLPTAAWAEERKDVPMSAGRWAWLPDSNQRHLARSDAAKSDRKHAAASDPRGIALDLKARARRTADPKTSSRLAPVGRHSVAISSRYCSITVVLIGPLATLCRKGVVRRRVTPRRDRPQATWAFSRA